MIQSICSTDDLAWARYALSSLTYDSYKLDAEKVSRHGWSLVLWPGVFWGANGIAKSLTTALTELGFETLYAVNTKEVFDERGQRDLDDFCFEISASDIRDFALEHSIFNYLITTKDLRFAILISYDGYSIISGPSNFIASVFNEDVDSVRLDFKEAAKERRRRVPDDTWFDELMSYYHNFSV